MEIMGELCELWILVDTYIEGEGEGGRGMGELCELWILVDT